MKIIRKIVVLFLIALLPQSATGDCGQECESFISGENQETTTAAKTGKRHKILPGEVVVTPSGQKMKVWSTESAKSSEKDSAHRHDAEVAPEIEDVHVIINRDVHHGKSD